MKFRDPRQRRTSKGSYNFERIPPAKSGEKRDKLVVSLRSGEMSTQGSPTQIRSKALLVEGRPSIYAQPAKQTGLWVKRDNSTGRFAKIKQSGGTFEGIERER